MRCVYWFEPNQRISGVKLLFKNHLYFLVFYALVFHVIILHAFYGEVNISNILGTEQDSLVIFSDIVTWLLYFVTYSVLSILRIRTNFILSAVHFVIIFVSFFMNTMFEKQAFLHLFLNLLSVLLFILNIAWAIRHHRNIRRL